MATQEAYVQVKDLKKHYGDGDARLTVLDGIDTSINRGEICVMLGPSGSGKSTFLNLIGGLEDADGGSIMVDGCDLTVLKPTDLGEYRRRELGFVFQFYNLVPDLTIKENIEVTAHLSKKPLNVDDLLRSLGLYEHRNKFPRQVSGGQQQRCAIGRALVKNPGLLLCDEPTGALDYKTSKEILQLMEDVNHEYGCTIIIVTHNAAIARMANRVLRLRDGRIVEDELNESPVAAAELDWEGGPTTSPSSIGRRRHGTSRKTSPARAAPQYRQVPGHLFAYVRKHRSHLGPFARSAFHRLPYRRHARCVHD